MGFQVRTYFNFYRIHLLCFTILPLLAALIFWLSNGEFKIRFIDALFVCISAATGTGLATIDLSSLTAWQQTIIVIVELVGNQVFVSWIIVYVRRSFFRQHLGHIIDANVKKTWTRRNSEPRSHLQRASNRASSQKASRYSSEHHLSRTSTPKRVHPGMVRRMDVAPKLINPMGMPARTVTIDATADVISRPAVQISAHGGQAHNGLRLRATGHADRDIPATEVGFGGFPGPGEILARTARRLFPGLHSKFKRTLTMPRTSTLIPQAESAQAIASPTSVNTARTVRYLSFAVDVDENSHFRGLTTDQLVELGGVEYRALNALLWIIPLYYIGLLACSIIIITPYMTLPQWRENFLPPQQHRKISPIWFSVFQVAGAWANTGMSLVDQNMIPFRTAYLMTFVLILCVLAGNSAFPVFFRLLLWLLSKVFPSGSGTKDALQFLLDHPRRCLINLFPSPHTWLLFLILIIMNLVTLAGDLVLNIHNPNTDTIPIGTRIVLSFLSSAAVRSAGFQGVAVSSLTPATQTLYVILMYISIYPIAMSVRTTNVYQERSLGVFPHEIGDDYADALENPADSNRVAIWGKYLMRHVQKQLTFDMWWLALSLFLLCVIERYNLVDPGQLSWFTTFALLFEVVSGYGTVGLSLGIPTANYSLSGAFHVISKLIICAVMLRGRHRGLPVALDRAVLLPHEFCDQVPEQAEEGSTLSQQSSDLSGISSGLGGRERSLPMEEQDAAGSSPPVDPEKQL